MGKKDKLKLRDAPADIRIDGQDDDLSHVAAERLERPEVLGALARRHAMRRKWVLLAILIALAVYARHELIATTQWSLIRVGVMRPIIFHAGRAFEEDVYLRQNLFPEEPGIRNGIKTEFKYIQVWMRHKLDFNEEQFLAAEKKVAERLEVWMNLEHPIPFGDEKIDIRLATGKLLRGPVERADSDGLTIRHRLGTEKISYRELDTTARLRLDLEFREHWMQKLARVYTLKAYGLRLEKREFEDSEDIARAAMNGNPHAQHTLGLAHMSSNKDNRDLSAAFVNFYAASMQGHAGAAFSLGRLYYMGKDIPRDRANAIRWIAYAANKGNNDAVDFLQGHLVEKYKYARAMQAAELKIYQDRLAFQGQLDAAFANPTRHIVLSSRVIPGSLTNAATISR